MVKHKRKEVSLAKHSTSLLKLDQMARENPPPLNTMALLRQKPLSLIAEVKKASPSGGVIRPDLNPVGIAKMYEEEGASAISVLTDAHYFQGSLEYLRSIRHTVAVPLLRKDFIIDEFQIYEARAYGADVVLLIARILEDAALQQFIEMIHRVGMTALVEVHSEKEVERVLKLKVDFMGINHRDLTTFQVDPTRSDRLFREFPELKKRVIISESGIKSASDIRELKALGVRGVLVGESILRAPDPRGKLRELLEAANE